MYLTHNLGSASALPIISARALNSDFTVCRKWHHFVHTRLGDHLRAPKMSKKKAPGFIEFKGAVSRHSVIFALFFARAKNGGYSRKCRGHRSLACRAAWQPCHLRWLLTVQWTYEKSSKCCTASLVDGDRQHFCFQTTRPDQGDIPFFKVQD